MEGCVVAGGAEVFGVDCSWAKAFFAFGDFGVPVDFFIAGVTEAFGVVLFFGFAIETVFYHHCRKNTFAC